MARPSPRFSQMEHRMPLLPNRECGRQNGEASLFDRILRELVLSERVIHGREAKTTMAIIDSKSVKNTNIACEKGHDAGKNFRDKGSHRC
jgi:hypothetical protein